jgi:hypothetical protein
LEANLGNQEALVHLQYEVEQMIKILGALINKRNTLFNLRLRFKMS